MVIWIHCLTGLNKAQCDSLFDGLHAAGFSTKQYDWKGASTPGIVIFDQADEKTCEFIWQSSNGGTSRILAVAFSRATLSDAAAWSILRSGASDVVIGKLDSDLVAQLAARLRRWKAVDDLIESPLVRDSLVGCSSAWIRVLRQVVEIARFTTAPVLITGESGTGKELIARLIHALDNRAQKGKLIILDCTTVVPELSGSEFFGHERGAFTGAVGSREGAFALANNGTLFLDEVGELPHSLQSELLRVVQEHTYKRVGSNTWQKTDFRLVSASNRQLHNEIERGNFRADLYYRMTSWTCHLPPLRERQDDILPLAEHFVREASGNHISELSGEIREYLSTRTYPGNIRELKQLVLRMVYRHVGSGPVTPGDIPEDERPNTTSAPAIWQDDGFARAIQRAIAMHATIRDIGRAAEDTAIRCALTEENGSWSRVAARLGVTSRALQLRRALWRRKTNNENDQAS